MLDLQPTGKFRVRLGVEGLILQIEYERGFGLYLDGAWADTEKKWRDAVVEDLTQFEIKVER